MSDILFAKIINEIKEGIDFGLIAEDVDLSLVLQNEPFLDNKIFERVEYIGEILPKTIVEVHSNGLLFDKYKEKIVNMEIDRFIFSLYGYDSEIFNYCTGVKINEATFNKMIKAFAYIKSSSKFDVVENFLWDKTPKGWKIRKNLVSRAGFLTNNKILHNTVSGCDIKRQDWLNIFSNGQVPLCCNDWAGEEIIGDVNKNSISQIILSKERQDAIAKIHGAESKKDFICKRCEWAKGDGDKTFLWQAE